MSRTASIVYTHGGGRLGNQVIRLAHWLAWTRAHPGAVNVVDMGFWRYAKYFTALAGNPGCAFPQVSMTANLLAGLQELVPERFVFGVERRLQHAVQAAGRRRPGGGSIALDDAKGESFDLDDPAFLRDVTSRRVTTCSGWKIASWRLVAEQQNELREFFRPKPAWTKVATDFIADLRARHDLVIGVQIRQSDYREWHDGRFCFSAAQYAAWMRQLLDLHAGRRVAFVVASEERQDPATFAGLPVYFATGSVNAGGHWFESWVELSLCDLIVSAPSTFAATAAFSGGTPLWPVTVADQTLARNQILADGMIGAARHTVFSLSVR